MGNGNWECAGNQSAQPFERLSAPRGLRKSDADGRPYASIESIIQLLRAWQSTRVWGESSLIFIKNLAKPDALGQVLRHMAQKRQKNRKSAIKAAANAADIRELRIPDSTIDQILKAMKVPETSWSDAAGEVYSAVQSCIDGRLGANKNRYRMIATTCDRLGRELSKLNNTERTFKTSRKPLKK